MEEKKEQKPDAAPPMKVGDYTVTVEYSDCQETLNDRMEQYLSRLAEREFL